MNSQFFDPTYAASGRGINPGQDEISDEEFNELAIEEDEFHGEWNYRILPRDFPINE
jgi:hypothetical protein